MIGLQITGDAAVRAPMFISLQQSPPLFRREARACAPPPVVGSPLIGRRLLPVPRLPTLRVKKPARRILGVFLASTGVKRISTGGFSSSRRCTESLPIFSIPRLLAIAEALVVVGVGSEPFRATATRGSPDFAASLAINEIHFEPIATPSLSDGRARPSFFGISSFTLTFPICLESRSISAQLLHSPHRLISSFGQKPCPVFRVCLDSGEATLLAGSLLIANAATVLGLNLETLAVPRPSGDPPPGLVRSVVQDADHDSTNVRVLMRWRPSVLRIAPRICWHRRWRRCRCAVVPAYPSATGAGLTK